MTKPSITSLLLAAIVLFTTQQLPAQIAFDREPIEYSSTPTNDAIAKLQAAIDEGKIKLEYDDEHGYLKSVLAQLGISRSSQMLVFSKTSFQLRRISPRSPRALYFNDDNYVGWVPHGDVIEVSSVDPVQGAVFYTLSQEEMEKPQFVRDKGNCLTCHASSRTQGVPGHLVRSVYPSISGQPHFGSGTFTTNHESPLNRRWGGWYVTGQHGQQRHMGNAVARERNRPESLDVEAGANVTDISDRAGIDRYLTQHSDIVALLVHDHQTTMHNLITAANYEQRIAMHHGAVMNRALERPVDYISDSTKRRLNSAAEKIVRYMLFVDEAPLTDRVQGTSKFTNEFSARGVKDAKRRSLREFDLTRRLFKYPCSYLINSDAFYSLPSLIKEIIYQRLWEVLTNKDESVTFAHLSREDRQAIREILRETHKGLPEYWKPDA